MTRVIGKGRYATETYPATGGGALAGAPFARLGISEPVAYTPGAGLTLIPFDTIEYESAPFGEFADVPGTGTVFRIPFGVYLAVLQIGSVDEDIEFAATVGITSASLGDTAGGDTAVSAVSVAMSAVRLASETPLPGGDLPCCVIPAFVPPAAGDPGELSVNLTKMLIWRLASL